MEEPLRAWSDHTKPFEVHTDASNFAIRRVLIQSGHPIAFESRKLNNTKRRDMLQGRIAVAHCYVDTENPSRGESTRALTFITASIDH